MPKDVKAQASLLLAQRARRVGCWWAPVLLFKEVSIYIRNKINAVGTLIKDTVALLYAVMGGKPNAFLNAVVTTGTNDSLFPPSLKRQQFLVGAVF